MRNRGDAVVVAADFTARLSVAPLAMRACTLRREHVVGAIVGIAVTAGAAKRLGMQATRRGAKVRRTWIAVIARAMIQSRVA